MSGTRAKAIWYGLVRLDFSSCRPHDGGEEMMEILFCVLTPEASLFPQVTQTIPTMMDASEELEVLLAREKNLYTTLDYQARMQMKSLAVAQASDSVATNQTECSPPRSKKTKSTSSTEEKARDDSGRSEKPFPHINYKRWREKMCNWAYKSESKQ